jgi:hypothetical protein
MSIWDDEELNATDDYIKFENIGDGVSGVVTSINKKTWDDGKVSVVLGITADNGDEKTLTAGQFRLKAALLEQRPEVGDHVSVFMVGTEKLSGGRTLKHFDVEVKRGEVADAVGTDVDAKKKTVPF